MDVARTSEETITTSACQILHFVKTEDSGKCWKAVKMAIKYHSKKQCSKRREKNFRAILNCVFYIDLNNSQNFTVCCHICKKVEHTLDHLEQK